MIPNIESKNSKLFLISLIFFFVIFVLGLLIANYLIKKQEYLSNRIYPKVYIDNQPYGEKTLAMAKANFIKKNTILKNAQISVLFNDSPVATFSAADLNIHSNGEEIVERAFLIGRSTHNISRIYQKLATIFNLSSFSFNTKIVYNKGQAEDFLSGMEDQYNKPARNALFSFENSKVVSFRNDEKGTEINRDKFINDLDVEISSISEKNLNKNIVLTARTIEPEVTLKDSNKFGIEELIGEGKSNFTHSSPDRVDNVILATSKFNGVLIPKNKVFSFDDTIGDISTLTGYKPAYIIKNGRTVLGDGGGVCQVSTTAFRAALNSGLPIVERHAHAYRVLYYENDAKPGLDATIFSPTVDLKFLNDTPGAILIQTEIDKEKNLLYFKFYGKSDHRKAEITEPVLYEESPPPPALYQDDPTLKKGVIKQVDYSAWGGKSKFSYKVVRDGETIYGKDFYSAYQPWKAVFLVGVAD